MHRMKREEGVEFDPVLLDIEILNDSLRLITI
jgi:hypothetical protein